MTRLTILILRLRIDVQFGFSSTVDVVVDGNVKIISLLLTFMMFFGVV